MCALAMAACRDASTTTTGGPEPQQTGSAVSVTSAPPPRLEAPGPDPAAEAIDRAFLDEPENPGWAAETVKAIRKRVPGATGITCRRTQCRFVLGAASTEDLAAAQNALSDPSSLAGIADVIPTPPTQRADGAVEVRIYAHLRQ